jgi:LysM repeat protein
MNNPNPFVPKGSILEQQSKRRSRLKLAVFCSLAVGVVGLSAMLIQGCKREQPADTGETPTIDTNTLAVADTNAPTIDTNAPAMMPPVVTNPPVAVTPPPVETPAGTEYEVVAHDTLAKIAKKFGVTVKALEEANPGVVPTKLKIKQKLTIPAGGGGTPTAPEAAATAGGQTYVVKSNDSFWKIARQFGTTLKALEAANPGVDPGHIKVGQKLNVPTKAEAAAPAPEPTPVVTPTLPPPASQPGTMPTH